MDRFSEEFYDHLTFKNVVHESQTVKHITFSDCVFDNCSFRETLFSACKFQNCIFKACDLSLIRVDASSFRNTRFEDSKVMGVNWVKASWGKNEIHQLLRSIDFTDCVINYSTFIGLNLEKILLKKCVARDVDFSEVNLTQANCRDTDFSNSRFRNTNLSGADFRGASGYHIVPHLNTLKKTRFSLPEAISLLYNLDIILDEAGDDEEIPLSP